MSERVSVGGKCERCGFAVPADVKFCRVCGPIMAKHEAPKATINTAPQPETAYTEGGPPVFNV